MFNLAILYRQQKDNAKAREWLFKSFAAGHADPEGTLLGWINWYEDHGSRDQVVPLLEAAVRESPGSEVYARTLGLYRFRRRDCPAAWEAIGPFAAKTSDPTTLNMAALVQTCLGKRDDAIVLLEKSLSLNPEQPGAIQSLKILREGPAKGN
jgi:tetratricopeptide (TPR) repeat protein